MATATLGNRNLAGRRTDTRISTKTASCPDEGRREKASRQLHIQQRRADDDAPICPLCEQKSKNHNQKPTCSKHNPDRDVARDAGTPRGCAPSANALPKTAGSVVQTSTTFMAEQTRAAAADVRYSGFKGQ